MLEIKYASLCSISVAQKSLFQRFATKLLCIFIPAYIMHLMTVRSWGKTKLTGFPRDLTSSVLLISRRSLQLQQKNNRSEPKRSTQHLFNSQNHWMNDLQCTFLILTASFSSASCCFSSGTTLKIVVFGLRLCVCVVVFIHKKENRQCFSCLLSCHFLLRFDHVL